jgi:predicted flavoprotein YhiN
MQEFDALIIGAGAAGLFCAGVAGQLGLRVLLLDHSDKVAEKIRISGGGRANFTNRDVSAANFISENPNFCRSALARYTPQHFIALMQQHGIAFHEKHKGQLFCDHSAQDLINMLLAECDKGQVALKMSCNIQSIKKQDTGSLNIWAVSYKNSTENDHNSTEILAKYVIFATGGLSIPKLGSTDLAYRFAREHGLRVVEPRPALVPLTFDGAAWTPYASLAGLALPVLIETQSGGFQNVSNDPAAPSATAASGAAINAGKSAKLGKKTTINFSEDLLFTHRGLSGPAVLQISSYWHSGRSIRINLAPQVDVLAHLLRAKATSRKLIVNELAGLVPARLAEAWVAQDATWQRPICDATDKALALLAERLTRWEITPTGTEGYKKAEVTAGGVDTRELSSQTMESRIPGLYFIGEAVDVTGWLGGYNFQWAWASAHACALALAASAKIGANVGANVGVMDAEIKL